MTKQDVGVEKLSFYTPSYSIDIHELAIARNMPPEKWEKGLGQQQMSVITPHEDIVTMAYEAALDILTVEDRSHIGLLLFATETGIDFSKAAGIYLHELLKLSPSCRVLEVKQACYAATGSLQLACDFVRSNPDKKALVVSSDIAWYGFKSAGEVTQGCGSIAMLVSNQPNVCSVEQGQVYTENVPDFYRPSFSEVPFVDGKMSIKSYLSLLKKVFKPSSLDYFCFHMPFATMGDKANKALGDEQIPAERLEWSKEFGKLVGNIYNGSLYLSLLSLIAYADTSLAGKQIGMFSYGSGAIGEFFKLQINKNYKQAALVGLVQERILNRRALSFNEYEELWTIFSEREGAVQYSPVASYQSPSLRIALEKVENGHRSYRLINDD